jgi:hypothetical protein
MAPATAPKAVRRLGVVASVRLSRSNASGSIGTTFAWLLGGRG